jgi:hypothetical protein
VTAKYLAACLLVSAPLRAAAPPTLAECLDGLSAAATTFSATAPGLMATETLDQRGRRGTIDLLRKATPGDLKKSTIRLPEEFRVHQVVSNWTLAPAGEEHALHEVRQIVEVDRKPVIAAGEARHALTIGLTSASDRTKRELLENFDQDELEGAVVDFSQVLLLFDRRHQTDYSFSWLRADTIDSEPMAVIAYRQTGGDEGLTAFHDRTEVRQTIRGEIWLRESDLLPRRITMNTEERWSAKYALRTEAQVDYAPSQYWLVPLTVTHKQFLNADVVMENDLSYADFHRADRIVP